MEKTMILVIDGCAPQYLTEETAPDVFRIAGERGFAKEVESEIPSVTNVNHACILSGLLPRDTKVVGNYYYVPETGEEGFIEERGFMKAETMLQAWKKRGKTTALFTVKGKVLGVYGEGADMGLSVQEPNEELVKALGMDMPTAVNSHESTEWILKAAFECIKKYSPDLMYCTNNDFVFHHYGPGTAEAKRQISFVNDYVKKIHELEPDRRIYITADHGMNEKNNLVNFPKAAENAGIDLFCLPPLKDRYIENHIYQEGGILYVFLKDKSKEKEFLDLAGSAPEVEKIMTAAEAAAEYGLPEESIGDYVLFAGKDSAFGEVEGERLETSVRTHGSLHERRIPLIAINPEGKEEDYMYNKDIWAVSRKIAEGDGRK